MAVHVKHKGIYTSILREKSLAINFGDSQIRRNRTFNLKVSKIYMLTNAREYEDITRLTFHIMLSLILFPLAKTAYLAIMRIVFD